MGCKGPTELLLEKWASNCRAAIIGRNSSSFRSSHCAGDKTTEKCVFLLAPDFLDKSRASSLALPCLLTSCRCRTTQWKQHRSSNELRMKIAYPPEATAQNCEWEENRSVWEILFSATCSLSSYRAPLQWASPKEEYTSCPLIGLGPRATRM